MHRRSPRPWAAVAICACLFAAAGCATARRNAPSADLRPCSDAYVYTKDGWRLGVRRYRSEFPDPEKLPVVLCHGLGLNATFWTITDDHLPSRLNAAGYDVYVFDIRASGDNARVGRFDRLNSLLRETPLRECGESCWSLDDVVRFDMPAVLEFVERDSGKRQVNWIGHSLGGMVVFPYLELSPEPDRIANFVGMGSTIIQATTPQRKMIQANAGIRGILTLASAGRLGRPLSYYRLPGMEQIDRFYYTAENVESRTVSRFYGYALEDPGPGALRQFSPYLRFGRLVSADGRMDYAAHLPSITTPTLLIAGAADLISDVPSTELTFKGLGSWDKTLRVYGKEQGDVHDYGHCDLVWSKHAPSEIFPAIIAWLEDRQKPLPSPQAPTTRATTLSPPGGP